MIRFYSLLTFFLNLRQRLYKSERYTSARPIGLVIASIYRISENTLHSTHLANLISSLQDWYSSSAVGSK